MTSAVLIPVKAPGVGKQRLAAALGEPARARLVEAMLAQVLEAVRSSPAVAEVHVLSPEPRVLPPGMRLVPDESPSLNAGLERARSALRGRGATRITVIFADLPLLSPDDVTALIRAGGDDAIAIARDHSGSGTNALCLPAEADFRLAFGAGSFARHTTEAQARGLRLRVLRRPGLAFDIDAPADLEMLRARRDPRYAFLA